MTIKALAFLLALPLAASAAERKAGLCAPDARPLFTAHPFRVWSCVPKDMPELNAAPEPIVLNRKEKAADLRGLAGSWRGIVNYAGQRYEVRLDVQRKGRGLTAEWSAMDYHTHDARALKGRLSPVFFDKGHLRGTLESEFFTPAAVDAYAGKPSSSTAAGFDQQLVWTVEGLKDRHDVLFTAQDDGALRFQYRYFPERGPGPIGASGRLTRVE